MNLEQRVVELAKARQVTISACESFTAGLFCDRMASVPGASAVLAGGVVTYWTAVKEDVVHVPAQIVDRFGVVSAQCAAAMAENIRRLMHTDFGISFTGNAGPSSMEEKPAGLVYCALSDGRNTYIYRWQICADRNTVRSEAVSRMLNCLMQKLEQK